MGGFLAKPEVKPEAKPKPKKPKLLDELKGKRVIVFMRNGYSLEGVIEEVSRYEIMVNDGNRKYVILKHGIDYIIPQ
jgi:RNA chaperone Hfq